MNKKGQTLTIMAIIGLGLIAIVLISFVFAIGGTIIKDVKDEILPEFNNIGNNQEQYNISEGTQAVTPAIDGVVDNYSVFGILLFIVGIMSIFGVAFAFRGEVSGWNIALFFAVVMMIVMISIFISNGYENLHDANNNLGQGLRAAPVLSFFILQSPTILTIISFLAGVILFSGSPRENLI